ncbi:hypothetical protein L1O03_08290 [Corynebacterium uropygiale]|uniref:Uncharacterized protein n=1 Tax=Corynebacterium uropygiale TaxID=1775911 RepID=A0A9X1QUE2_9CORY|nr:hypothetical protein [Corynebacterium uropygiale]MCF4007170.1 hypothetical protein [Corynebacterium uropygiale]
MKAYVGWPRWVRFIWVLVIIVLCVELSVRLAPRVLLHGGQSGQAGVTVDGAGQLLVAVNACDHAVDSVVVSTGENLAAYTLDEPRTGSFTVPYDEHGEGWASSPATPHQRLDRAGAEETWVMAAKKASWWEKQGYTGSQSVRSSYLPGKLEDYAEQLSPETVLVGDGTSLASVPIEEFRRCAEGETNTP